MPENRIKRASWLELFYDLAFVALVAQLTYLAADNFHSLEDALNIFIVGYTIFIAWWGTTANRNLQDSEGTTDKLLVQTQMAGAFLMSITMPAVFVGDYFGYFATLAIMRLMLVGMVLRMYRLFPDSAPQTKNILQGMTIAAGLWLASAFVAAPYHFVLAGMALLLDILTPLTRGKGNMIQLLNVNHMQERLGLFLMLVLGESMLVVALANTATTVDLIQPIIVFSGFVITVALWWIYFQHLERCAEGVRPKQLLPYLHAHGWLFGSIILLAAGFKNMIKHEVPTQSDLLLYGLGILGILFTISMIRMTLHGFSKTILSVSLCMSAVVLGILFGIGGYFGETLVALVVSAVFVGVIPFFDLRPYRKS